MNNLATQHAANKAQLEDIAATLSLAPPSAASPNPLLSRGKLKPAKKTKPKSKKKGAIAAEVAEIKADELGVVSASIGYADHGVADGEEGDVLDLADRLLEQLHAQEEAKEAVGINNLASVSPCEGLGASFPANPPTSTSSEATPASKPSSSSRDTLHDLKEDMLGMLHIGGHGSGDGQKKVSRQQARKVKRRPAPPPGLAELRISLAAPQSPAGR